MFIFKKKSLFGGQFSHYNMFNLVCSETKISKIVHCAEGRVFTKFSMYVVGKYHPVLFCHRRLIQQYTYTSSCIIFQAFYYTRNEKMWYFHEILFHVFILVNLVTIKAISASNNEEELHLWKETMQELEKFRQIVNNLAINQKEVRQSANDHTIGKKHALNR